MPQLRNRQLEWATGILAIRNISQTILPTGAYIPVNLAVGALLVVLAHHAGSSWEALGLARRHLRRGLRIGGIVAAAAAATMALGAAIPATRLFFDDDRVAVDEGTGELLYQTLLRIPVGTALFEEVAFRGVLLALLRRQLDTRTAVAVESALFGLWHIVPTLSTASTNEIDGLTRLGLVTGAVLATTAGGVFFSLLRLRSGHLAAPILVHLAFNDTGYLLAWWVRS